MITVKKIKYFTLLNFIFGLYFKKYKNRYSNSREYTRLATQLLIFTLIIYISGQTMNRKKIRITNMLEIFDLCSNKNKFFSQMKVIFKTIKTRSNNAKKYCRI